ncbi:hypothetical protein TRFO_32889 [Tritrichomonas foetus]|uniref:Intimal thickness related receptor IRP domain-containing protein n=1 Tax=Tritrichomonas foetus TaxID=1144522 RepID=A0A1J4JMY5_9EUKA|nr:hypothetical protein TRFO_32889 [Tritrichomonas foetus]|eukprot:OHT00435.1 hypothetical protein TRFO_32889 [Tritrichomonas foetus]
MKMFLFFLLFRRSFIIQTWGEKAILDKFGFLTDGCYEFNFTEVKANFVFASLCTKSEFKRIRKIKSLCKLPEDEYPAISNLIQVYDDGAYFSGNISEGQILYPVFSACNLKHARYKLTYILQNENSKLDSRMIPCMITKPICLTIYSILGLVWVLNWVFNCKVKNSLHAHFTISIFASILFLLFQTMEIFHFSKSEGKTVYQFLRIIFRMIQFFSIFSMVLVIANGVCSIHLEIPFIQLLQSVLISFGVIAPSSILEMIETPRDAFRIECVSIFIALRLYFLLKYLQLFNSSVELFFKDNQVISLDEIKEKTKEFKRFRSHFRHILCYMIVLFLVLSIDDFRLIYYWVSQMLQDGILFAILCESGWICRLQSVALVIEAENLENRNGIRWEKMRLETMRK